MVITTSDSNSTLVSLGNNRKHLNNNVGGLKRVSSLEVLRSSPTTQSYDFEPSALLTPLDDDDVCFSTFEEMGSDYSCGSDDGSFYNNCYDPSFEQQQQQQPIYLPSSSCSNADLGVDECLKCIPQIMERCDELLAVEPVRYTKKSPESILHVGQGEVAHAVPSQCDIIMSDKATTCHILALRSTTTTGACYSADNEPLVSLCHIDSTHYEECIRSMFARHAAHNNNMKQDTTNTPTIRMDVHLIGGFNDSKGTSLEISNWLVSLLADLAAQHKKDSNMQVTLQTCAISSMNESGHESPIGRGLAVHLQSGQAFLACCDEHVAGPDACLRAVRLWCPSSTGKTTLSCIHNEHSKNGTIEITPFDFKPFPEINRLLALPDHVMIQYCSTSPDCEEDDFCTCLRRTLHFLRTATPQQVFGKDGKQARVYQRIIIQKNKQQQHVFASNSSSSTNYSNTWKLAAYP